MRKTVVEKKSRLNIFALVSILMLPLLALGLLFVLLNNMYQWIPLRDFQVTPWLMFLVIALVLGIVMLVTAIIGLVKHFKHKDDYKGSWMAYIGGMFGLVCVAVPLFFVIDYLIQMN